LDLKKSAQLKGGEFENDVLCKVPSQKRRQELASRDNEERQESNQGRL
jgi:hypothetical protein